MYQEDRNRRFYDGCAAERRLRQRLHRPGTLHLLQPLQAIGSKGDRTTYRRRATCSSAAQQPLIQATRCIRKTAIAGFTTAAPPIAGFASGYTGRGPCICCNRSRPLAARVTEQHIDAAQPVAAGAACDRLRSSRNPSNAVGQEDRNHRFYDGCAAERRLRQRLHRADNALVVHLLQQALAIGQKCVEVVDTGFQGQALQLVAPR